MFKEFTIDKFTGDLASNTPVPGGGSASAMAGATAVSLVSMVASLTEGKKGYEEVQGEMAEIKVTMEEYRQFFLDAMDKDADSYAGVMEAYKLPKDTDAEKAARTKAIQDNLYAAALMPLEVAEKALEIFEFASKIVEKGNKNAVSDGAVSALFARTAVKGALHNVEINAASLDDPERKSFLLSRVSQLEKDVDTLEQEVLNGVEF